MKLLLSQGGVAGIGTILSMWLLVIVMKVSGTGKTSSTLSEAFIADPRAQRNVILIMKQKTTDVVNQFSVSSRAVKTEEEMDLMNIDLMSQMQKMTGESQSDVLSFLEGEAPGSARGFWITNRVLVVGANQNTVSALEQFENVEEIHEEKIYRIPKPLRAQRVTHTSLANKKTTTGNMTTAGNVQWNINKIGAPKVWGGGDGTGCTVGITDTGINEQHEAFPKGTVKGFKDMVNNKTNAYDDAGHGSHVAGTICGQNGIGVAPNSTVVACKACDSSGSCTQSCLYGCGQYMQQMRPSLVSNSWGGSGNDKFYDDVIQSWSTSSILGIFACGNSGPGCKTLGSPGDNPKVISVAATTSSDGLADFSSRGTSSRNGEVGPTVSAPGEDITSCWFDSNTSYKTISGTSMATPHVAGTAALLFARKATMDQVRTAIIKSCKTSGMAPMTACGGTKSFPNNLYGNGRIDCVKAVDSLQSAVTAAAKKKKQSKKKTHG